MTDELHEDDSPPLSRESISGDGEVSVDPAGHFRLYLGSAPGVGKTFAMLDEGHRRSARGTDVVIGFVESHNRPHTLDRIGGLEIVPRKRVPYRGTEFEEMDVDAIIARHPQVALIDELAHTNAIEEGRHPKRWQDVFDILEAGIDVISAVNIQHLESIAELVERITGVAIRERVPDWVVRRADQIELIDSSPEQLRRRMLHGNIYPKAKVPQALGNFFKVDNLSALRELALRFLADETEEDLHRHLHAHHLVGRWETTERIMVAVSAARGTDAMIHRAARIAARIKAPIDAVHVVSADSVASESAQIGQLRETSISLGALWSEVIADDWVDALMWFAAENTITQIVVGATPTSWWQEYVGSGSRLRRLQRRATRAGIDVHIIALSTEMASQPELGE